jgi:hypothetical protein
MILCLYEIALEVGGTERIEAHFMTFWILQESIAAIKHSVL